VVTEGQVPRSGWRQSAEAAARRLAAITGVGVLLGLLVGGVGGRLAMLLLARLNPEATGVTSDDGFRIGQFTLPDTLNLLLVGTAFGLVGSAVYAVLRGLMTGPRWFQVLSVAGGPAIVVGAAIVHPDGVDFRLLHPTWLAIGLFVAIPGCYAALLTALAERLVAADGWAMRTRLAYVAPLLVLWAPLAPVLVLLAAVWAAREALRRSPRFARPIAHPALPWAGRAALLVLFLLSALDLTQDASALG
jgi:hypothetical protein